MQVLIAIPVFNWPDLASLTRLVSLSQPRLFPCCSPLRSSRPSSEVLLSSWMVAGTCPPLAETPSRNSRKTAISLEVTNERMNRSFTIVWRHDLHLSKHGQQPLQARFFDIEDIKDKKSEYPHMLPNASQFADQVGDLGISNIDHVVVYDTVGFSSAPRVYWMLKVITNLNTVHASLTWPSHPIIYTIGLWTRERFCSRWRIQGLDCSWTSR